MPWQEDFALILAQYCETEGASECGFEGLVDAPDFDAVAAIDIASNAADTLAEYSLDGELFVYDFLTAISKNGTIGAAEHIAANRRMRGIFSELYLGEYPEWLRAGGLEAAFRRLSFEEQGHLVLQQIEHLSPKLPAKEVPAQRQLILTLFCWHSESDPDLSAIMGATYTEPPYSEVSTNYDAPSVWRAFLAIARRLRTTP